MRNKLIDSWIYTFPKLNQEDVRYKKKKKMSTSNIEVGIKNLSTKKTAGIGRFTSEFFKKFKEDLTPLFLAKIMQH